MHGPTRSRSRGSRLAPPADLRRLASAHVSGQRARRLVGSGREDRASDHGHDLPALSAPRRGRAAATPRRDPGIGGAGAGPRGRGARRAAGDRRAVRRGRRRRLRMRAGGRRGRGLVRSAAFGLAAVLAACAPAAYQQTTAHPASSEAAVGPRVTLPAAEESAESPAQVPADAPAGGGHDHHQHVPAENPQPPRKEAPAAPSAPPPHDHGKHDPSKHDPSKHQAAPPPGGHNASSSSVEPALQPTAPPLSPRPHP